MEVEAIPARDPAMIEFRTMLDSFLLDGDDAFLDDIVVNRRTGASKFG